MTRREWRDLGWVLALALALRVALWWVLPREALISDEPEYLGAAYWLANGRGFSFYAAWPWLRPPAYLLFLAPFLRLFGLNLTPVRIVQVLLSLSVPALTYLWGRAAFGPRVAKVAGLIAAVWLPFAVLPHLALAENLFLPFLLAGFYCLVRWQKGSAVRVGVSAAPGRPAGGELATGSAAPREREEAASAGSARGWVWATCGGLLLGLATLTRGLTVAFLPVAAVWMLVHNWRGRAAGTRRTLPLRDVLLFTLAACLVILPWTGYNYLRYGRLILVDTTGGYNFWLGTQGGQFHNLRDVQQALLDLPDPAARQSYAYEQGLGAIAADPVGYLGNRAIELGQLLRINYGADERLLGGFVLGQVSGLHLLAVFLLEDTLYLFLVPLAVFGLFLQRREAGRGLTLLWLGYNLAVAVAFFAINRFRLPLMPLLVVYAAAAVSPAEPAGQRDASLPAGPAERGRPGGIRRGRASFWARFVAALLLSLAFWAVVMPSYAGPYPASAGATLLGLRGCVAAGHLARAEEALSAGNLEQAWAELQPALDYRPDGLHPVGPAQVVLAEWRRAGGDAAGALAALEGVEGYQATLLRGDILRAQGDPAGAEREFAAREVREQDVLPWAWGHLQPPPSQAVDVGGGLDLGLVDGFYAPEVEGEVTYRWSGATAQLRFPAAATGRPLTLGLRLRGWRPAGEAPAEVSVMLANGEVARFTATAEWQELAVELPAVAAGEDIVLTLRTTPFLAGPVDLLQTGRLRMLGVMVDWARVGKE